jgi:hypothetical protein
VPFVGTWHTGAGLEGRVCRMCDGYTDSTAAENAAREMKLALNWNVFSFRGALLLFGLGFCFCHLPIIA